MSTPHTPETLKQLADSFNSFRASDLDSLWAYAQEAQKALDAVADELKMRAIDRFEQRVVDASWQHQQGNPLDDFLTPSETAEAVNRLADIYTALGRAPTVS